MIVVPAGPLAPAHRHQPRPGRHHPGRFHRPALGPPERRRRPPPGIIGSRFSPECCRCASSWPAPASRTSGSTPTVTPRWRPSCRSSASTPTSSRLSSPRGRSCAVPRPAPWPSTWVSRCESLPDRCFDLVIVGGGPAGLAAAVYGASEGLRTLGLEKFGDRWAGGVELADRELPRLPHRHLGRRPHPAGLHPGREVRRLPHRPVRGDVAARGGGPPDPRPVRRQRGGGPRRHRGQRRTLPAPRRRSPRGVRGQRRLLRRDRDWSGASAVRRRSSSSAVATPPGRRRCSSPTPAPRDHRHPRRRSRREHVALPDRPHRHRTRASRCGRRRRSPGWSGRSLTCRPWQITDATGTTGGPLFRALLLHRGRPVLGLDLRLRRLDDRGFVLTDRALSDRGTSTSAGRRRAGCRCRSRRAIPGCSPWATCARARPSEWRPPSARVRPVSARCTST